ncbi:MAG: cytochrome c oxidase subunit II [Ktedonobacteraceae bacterium]|nr:cytochrome c oxidase subunit II [Ktedonobacteraceae bacterium]
MRMPLFRGTKKRWPVLGVGALLSSLLFSACDTPNSILNTHGTVASSESFVFWVILGIATFIFVIVEAALIYSSWRFRERPGMAAPRQLHGNTTLEVAWTAAPAIVLLVVLVFTIRGLWTVSPENIPTDGPTLTVEAIGHQWWWEFYYPSYNITTADTLHVPVGETVNVELYSNNVIHSFWIPALTGKTDVIPGHDNTRWFIADKAGAYQGLCAEFCGLQHANMRFNVKAESAADFNSWAISQQQAAASAPAAGSMAAAGQAIFKAQCSTCHGIIGVDSQSFVDPTAKCDNPNGTTKDPCFVGPNLTHFASRATNSDRSQVGLIAGGVLENNLNDPACQPGNPQLLQQCGVAQWLNDPQGIKPGNDMNIGQLSKGDISKLVAYLETLK